MNKFHVGDYVTILKTGKQGIFLSEDTENIKARVLLPGDSIIWVNPNEIRKSAIEDMSYEDQIEHYLACGYSWQQIREHMRKH